MAKTIDLNEAEVKLLKELLQGDMARLLLEIAHTDHREMRAALQKRFQPRPIGSKRC